MDYFKLYIFTYTKFNLKLYYFYTLSEDLSSDDAGGGAAAKLTGAQLKSLKNFIVSLCEKRKESIGDLQVGIINLHRVTVLTSSVIFLLGHLFYYIFYRLFIMCSRWNANRVLSESEVVCFFTAKSMPIWLRAGIPALLIRMPIFVREVRKYPKRHAE